MAGAEGAASCVCVFLDVANPMYISVVCTVIPDRDQWVKWARILGSWTRQFLEGANGDIEGPRKPLAPAAHIHIIDS